MGLHTGAPTQVGYATPLLWREHLIGWGRLSVQGSFSLHSAKFKRIHRAIVLSSARSTEIGSHARLSRPRILKRLCAAYCRCI